MKAFTHSAWAAERRPVPNPSAHCCMARGMGLLNLHRCEETPQLSCFGQGSPVNQPDWCWPGKEAHGDSQTTSYCPPCLQFQQKGSTTSLVQYKTPLRCNTSFRCLFFLHFTRSYCPRPKSCPSSHQALPQQLAAPRELLPAPTWSCSFPCDHCPQCLHPSHIKPCHHVP